MADAYGEPLHPKQERSYSLEACMPLLFSYRCTAWFVQVPCKVPEVFGKSGSCLTCAVPCPCACAACSGEAWYWRCGLRRIPRNPEEAISRACCSGCCSFGTNWHRGSPAAGGAIHWRASCAAVVRFVAEACDFCVCWF